MKFLSFLNHLILFPLILTANDVPNLVLRANNVSPLFSSVEPGKHLPTSPSCHVTSTLFTMDPSSTDFSFIQQKTRLLPPDTTPIILQNTSGNSPPHLGQISISPQVQK